MIPIIATTMRSSINEKPSWRLVVMLVCCSLKRLGGFQSLAPPAFVPFVSRAKREVVGYRLNNRYAMRLSAQKRKISIFFDQNFDGWATRARSPDNLWQGGNDAFRQCREEGQIQPQRH